MMVVAELAGRELTLRETQMAAFRILEQIDAVCKKEGLRYWLWYGTLIGAVRHGGFIPWDDDLDIAMPRRDYELFLRAFERERSAASPLVAINRSTGGVSFLITRISDTTYRMLGEYDVEDDRMGAFVDVYPLDGVGCDRDSAIARKKKTSRLIELYLFALNPPKANQGRNAPKKCAKRAVSFVLGGHEKYLGQLEQLCALNDFDSSDYVSMLNWREADNTRILERRSFDETLLVDFEGMACPIPAGFDDILKVTFGEYMRLPEEHERTAHHEYKLMMR